jgi:adenine phosphoribosyltransferase
MILSIMPSRRMIESIRTVPNFPRPGIIFFDLLLVLRDSELFLELVKELSSFSNQIDCVVGIEARGLILGAAVARELGKGFVPLRKKGKLPGEVAEESYSLEYGIDILEVQVNSFEKGNRVLLIDDVLATGGTLIAGAKLVQKCGADVVAAAVALEIRELSGFKNFTQALPGIDVFSAIRI